MAPVVDAYQAMRGASFIVAVTFAAEIGSIDSPGGLTQTCAGSTTRAN